MNRRSTHLPDRKSANGPYDASSLFARLSHHADFFALALKCLVKCSVLSSKSALSRPQNPQ